MASPTREPYNFVLRVVPEASYPTRLSTLLLSRYPTQASTLSVVNAGKGG